MTFFGPQGRGLRRNVGKERGAVERSGWSARYARRDFLGLGLASCACGLCGSAQADSLHYDLQAVEIAPHTHAVFGARDYFSSANGGNIVNTAFIAVPDGIVLFDSGPSRRYGEALRDLVDSVYPGRPILRLFNSHHHPDHFLGNQAFDPNIVAAPQGVIDNIAAEGDGFADNLYRLLGDWMRGTAPQRPRIALTGDGEDIGGRQFSYLSLAGHSGADLAIRDNDTGVLFSGDLAFLDRAPTTPHASLPLWRSALDRLAATDHALLLPGHGPADARGAALEQTRDYLDWLEGSLREAVLRGLTMNEAMALPIPRRFSALGAVRGEVERSVVHLYPRLEQELFENVPVQR